MLDNVCKKVLLIFVFVAMAFAVVAIIPFSFLVNEFVPSVNVEGLRTIEKVLRFFVFPGVIFIELIILFILKFKAYQKNQIVNKSLFSGFNTLIAAYSIGLALYMITVISFSNYFKEQRALFAVLYFIFVILFSIVFLLTNARRLQKKMTKVQSLIWDIVVVGFFVATVTAAYINYIYVDNFDHIFTGSVMIELLACSLFFIITICYFVKELYEDNKNNSCLEKVTEEFKDDYIKKLNSKEEE